MAKTTAKRGARKGRAGPQAPVGAWSPDSLLTALKRGTIDEKIAVLHKAGILDENGELTQTYKSWGSKASRTPDLESDAE